MKYLHKLRNVPSFEIKSNSIIGIAHIPTPSGKWIERQKVQEIVTDADRELSNVNSEIDRLRGALEYIARYFEPTAKDAESMKSRALQALK